MDADSSAPASSVGLGMMTDEQDDVQGRHLGAHGRQRYAILGLVNPSIDTASLTVSLFLRKLEDLAPQCGYRLPPHVSPERGPSTDEIREPENGGMSADDAAASILGQLYNCVLDPRWCLRFVPPSALEVARRQVATTDDDIMVEEDAQSYQLARVTSSFSLRELQGESGEPEYSEARRGKACGHVFKQGEGVWHCVDCALDHTCVLCSRCFRASNHVGHAVNFSVHSSGVGSCDCGDPEAWKNGLECGYHSHRAAPLAPENDSQAVPLPEECKAAIRTTVRLVLDFIDHVLDGAPDVVAPPLNADAIKKLLSRREREDRPTDPASMEADGDPAPPRLAPAAKSPGGFRALFSPSRKASDPKGKGKIGDWPDPSSLFASTLPSSSSAAGAAAVSSSSKVHFAQGEGPWTAMLWNDEKHSYAQVIAKVAETTSCGNEAALRVAQRVDTRGRDVLSISSDPNRLAAIAQSIASMTLGVTVRHAADAFVEMALDLCVDFLADLAGCRVYDASADDEAFLGQAVLDALCEPMPPLGRAAASGSWRSGQDGQTRFERLLTNDTRLWKEPRQKLKSLYVKLIGLSADAKRQLGRIFAACYPRLAEDYFVDREPEYTVLDLSVQILTVPSVATDLVKDGFLGNLMRLLYALFTDQYLDASAASRPSRKLLRADVDYNITAVLLEGQSLKQKRHLHLFNEIGYLLASAPAQRAAAAEPRTMYELERFLNLFTNMNPAVRAVDAHVEFENDVWVAVFNLTIQLSRLARHVGACLASLPSYTEPELRRRVEAGVPNEFFGPAPTGFLAQTRMLARLMVNPKSVRTHRVRFGGSKEKGPTEYTLVQFRTEAEPVSFHHPLNWTLAEMLRSAVDGPDRMRCLSIREVFSELQPDLGTLLVAENVFRVLALIAQIRAGLWVRNGFGLRAQHLHYRDAALRENTFDQDLFMIQAVFAGADPGTVLVALIDRFGLLGWFEDEAARRFEQVQIVTLLEELLWLVTVVAAEPAAVADWPAPARLRREVAHVLSLAPLTFTEIEKRVPDRLTEDSADLDRVLADVADFKKPAATSDLGLYSLKKDVIAELDPYFYRFNRNQREECEKLVTAHARRITGDPHAVRTPRASPVTTGPFAGLRDIFTSDVLVQVLFTCLSRFGPQSQAYSENLADQAINLIMLGLVEQKAAFATLAAGLHFTLDGAAAAGAPPGHRMSLVAVLLAIESEQAMASLKAKVSWCLEHISVLLGQPRPSGEPRDVTTIDDPSGKPAAEDGKKAAAKARQEAIMKQMAAQQAQALKNLGDFDDDDDDDDLMEGTAEAVSHGQCIVCQDELHDGDSFGMLCFVQTSHFVRQIALRTGSEPDLADDRVNGWLCEALEVPDSLDIDARLDGPWGVAGRRAIADDDELLTDSTRFAFPGQDRRGLYASACGHLMHLTCFQTYDASVHARHLSQVVRNHPENVERFEFLCPLCRSVGNCLLPHAKAGAGLASQPPSPDLATWIDAPEVPGLPDANLTASRDPATLIPWVIDEIPIQRGSERAAASEVPKPAAKMLERFATVCRALHRETEAFRGAFEHPSGGSKRGSLDEDLIGYTVSCIEISSRGHGHAGGVTASVTDSQRRLLHALFGALRQLLAISARSPLGPEMGAAMLRRQFRVPEDQIGTQKPHLLRDPIAILVQIAAVAPQELRHAVAICYYLEVFRVTFGLARLGMHYKHEWWRKARRPPAAGTEDVSEGQLWRSLVVRFFAFSSSPWENAVAVMDDVSFQKLISAHTLPYLRRAAILQGVVSDGRYTAIRSLPEALEFASENDRLRWQLDIPPVSDIFANGEAATGSPQSTISGLMMRWLNHFHRYIVAKTLSGNIYRLLPRLEHPAIYELVGLPLNYNALVAETAQRKCARCHTVPTRPSVCLLCGTIVCTQQYCCMSANIADNPEHGECNMHMWSCGGSVGAFLSVTDCAVLYLATQNGTMTTAPYLDDHGETNMAMRRGRPQYLHRPRWDEIRKLWLNHMIPTHVARKQDGNTDAGGWPTL